MHTLTQLKSGELAGVNRVKITDGLTTFPTELYALADTLEILDLTGNQLNRLPDDFHKLHNLKILFLSDNQFDHLPAVLGQCQKLEMIGFKANQIKTVAGNSLPPKTRWLILTDNQIESLPNAIGQLTRLQKLMLAGNQLKSLPSAMANCTNLQLIRLSANQLTDLPDWLLRLPKLAWLAFAGNPLCQTQTPTDSETEIALPTLCITEFELKHLLGEGASGLIYQAQHQNPQSKVLCDVAVKLFKGEVTSDGYPHDELQACLKVGHHPNLVKTTAKIVSKNQTGLVMDLIPQGFFNLGLPPTFETCTRDTFKKGFTLSAEQTQKIIHAIRDVLNHLHDKQLTHGDLYAHNILIDDNAKTLLSDFGAASPFGSLPSHQQSLIKAIEQRALKHLVEDLENLIPT